MFRFKKVLISFAIIILSIGLTTGIVNAEVKKVGTITGSVVNVRAAANITAKVIDTLPKGRTVSVVSKSGDWYKVSYSSIKGWVSEKYIKVKQVPLGTGKVIVSSANVRAKATTSSKVVTTLLKNKTASVLLSSGNWYKVKTKTAKIGWVRKDLMRLYRSSTTSRSGTSNDRDSNSATRANIVAYAKTFLGCQYSYGGSSPSGFDCSGFTSYVFKHFNIYLNRSADDQMSQGTYVSKSNLLPGDLVFFGYGSYADHASIYIGNGQIIHAANTAKDVCISNLSESYYVNKYLMGRRVIK